MKHISRFAAWVLSALLLLPLCAPAAGAIGPVSRDLRPGADVSVWQGEIDFSSLRSGGTEIVYIRAGYGSDGVDTQFRRNAVLARAAGLSVGFYHYVTAETTAEAVEQARFFAGLIREHPYDCRPAMDFESFHGLPREQVNAVARAFLTELERLTGQVPLLYANADDASRLFSGDLARYPLWAADYGPAQPQVTAHWTAWTGFQYTDRGRLPGIQGPVDLDWFTPGVLLSHSPAPSGRTYVVQKGDTLWAISRRYGLSVSSIARYNHIPNPDLIFPGQVLRLPTANERTYMVQRGDTLWAIARRYGLSVSSIARYNHILNPDLIFPGQVLRFPAGT